jgi:hypothetical protein
LSGTHWRFLLPFSDSVKKAFVELERLNFIEQDKQRATILLRMNDVSITLSIPSSTQFCFHIELFFLSVSDCVTISSTEALVVRIIFAVCDKLPISLLDMVKIMNLKMTTWVIYYSFFFMEMWWKISKRKGWIEQMVK